MAVPFEPVPSSSVYSLDAPHVKESVWPKAHVGTGHLTTQERVVVSFLYALPKGVQAADEMLRIANNLQRG